MENIELRNIIKEFAERGVVISPEALSLLEKTDYRVFLDNLHLLGEEVAVILPSHLEAIKRALESRTTVQEEKSKIAEQMVELKAEIEIEEIPEIRPVKGELTEFIDYFLSRYERISNLFSENLRSRAKTIAETKVVRKGEKALIIGLVRRRMESRDKRLLIMTVEDKTGSMPVFLPPEYKRIGERITVDQVIALRGTTTGNGGLNVEKIFQPDVQEHEPNRAEKNVKVVLVSDLHVGSMYFNEEAFNSFIKWLSSPKARLVNYLVIAGDLVDGIGVYPNQEEELMETDIFEQFKIAAELLSKVPERITIIYVPGNHEPVRQAEPQPKVPDNYASPLLEIDREILLLPNPCYIKLSGVRFLIYHGRSLNAIFKHVPGLQPISPDTVPQAMKELLKARSLVPVYGESPIAPQPFDWLVIDKVPDVFHTGHIHVYGLDEYKRIKIVNTGTFQNQTPYLKGMEITPTTGTAAIINLRTLDVKMMNFAK
ncbi:MAG TPA: DNA-directed DNA polymerase II small subunit [Candidatus Korarchaeota archaeon]|nr:DNA-directed DNA polymerase II small subunit [Candidatus Korarchaeota archaeon]